MRSPILNVTSGFLAFIATPVVAIKAAVARRKVMGHLAGFDDHLLRDIGLTRGDIDAVMYRSLRDDPTLRLALMVREARLGRRAAVREQLDWARTAATADSYGSTDIDRRAA